MTSPVDPKTAPRSASSRADTSQPLLARCVSAWVLASARRPIVVLVAATLLTALSAWYAAGHLGVDTDKDSLFPADLPFRVTDAHYLETFPIVRENIVIVVDAPTGEGARRAASELAGALEAEPELFDGVYQPRNDFFERNAFLYLGVDELDDLADRLAFVQPYITALAEDGSLETLSRLLARGLQAAREGDIEGDELVPMIDALGNATLATTEGRAYEIDWSAIMAGRELGDDARRRLILARPRLDFGALAHAEKPLQKVRALVAELGLAERFGGRVRVTGDVALNYEEMHLVESQARLAGITSFVVVTGLLLAGLRAARPALAVAVSTLCGLALTGAFAALAVGHLNMISVAFAVLFIGLGVDFGIHLCMRYQELRGRGLECEAALERTADGVGSSLVLCAATTSIGFFAFLPTDFLGVAELGLIAGVGMFISLACTFTMIPAMLALASRSTDVRPLPSAQLPTFPVRHPRAVGVAAALVGLAALGLVPQLRFDQNPLNVRDPSAESVTTFAELLKKGRTSPWSLNVVAPDRESARRMAAELNALPEVEQAVTVWDFVPEAQSEKLSIIEDVALFLELAESGAAKARGARAVDREALDELDRQLEQLIEGEQGRDLVKSAAYLHFQLERFRERLDAERDPDAYWTGLEARVLTTLPDQLAALRRALEAREVRLENLPAGLLERMLTSGGQARIRVFPTEDLMDAPALEAFVTAVRGVAPEAAGSAIRIYESARAVVEALREAFVAAVIVIAVLLWLLWRTLSDMVLVMAPLALAALMTGGAMVLLGIPFNFADVIVLPLLLGIGVDSGIHLVHRHRTGDEDGESLLTTSTARAVIYSALTTIASFGSLAFLPHRGMASLGQLLTAGVAFTVFCNLFVLPALIELRARRRSQGVAASEKRAAGAGLA